MTDYYLLDDLLTDEARAVRDRVRAFVDHEVLPVINGYWERAEFTFELVPKIAELGIVGTTIEGYGCPGLSPLAAGTTLLRPDGVVAGAGSLDRAEGFRWRRCTTRGRRARSVSTHATSSAATGS